MNICYMVSASIFWSQRMKRKIHNPMYVYCCWRAMVLYCLGGLRTEQSNNLLKFLGLYGESWVLGTIMAQAKQPILVTERLGTPILITTGHNCLPYRDVFTVRFRAGHTGLLLLSDIHCNSRHPRQGHYTYVLSSSCSYVCHFCTCKYPN